MTNINGVDREVMGTIFAYVCIGMVFLLLFIGILFAVCSSGESTYEEHYIKNIEFQNARMDNITNVNEYFIYCITIETGELLDTDLESLEIGKKYSMEIREWDNGYNRYLYRVIKLEDGD